MIAVVCTGGEPPPVSRSLAWIDAAAMVVAADGGLTFLRDLGKRADLWVGDGDSLGSDPALWSPWYREALVLERAKDPSDTEAAVQAAFDRGADQIWLLGGAGLRMDHWWANLRLAASCRTLTRWLTAHEEIWNLGPGDELSLGPGTVSVFPLGAGPWSIGAEGLRWPLDTVDFSRWHSLSNQAGVGGCRVVIRQGCFLVLKPFAGDAL